MSKRWNETREHRKQYKCSRCGEMVLGNRAYMTHRAECGTISVATPPPQPCNCFAKQTQSDFLMEKPLNLTVDTSCDQHEGNAW